MTGKADWAIGKPPIDPDSNDRLFFDEHEWKTVEAATTRIMPTDHDPGAREACVARFIDHYLSGIDYVFAAPDGNGFLQIEGKAADAWRIRIEALQRMYRDGIRQLDEVAHNRFSADFVSLDESQQDEILEELSGAPKPEPVRLGKQLPAATFLQAVADDGLDFFHALCLHTRQGFYGDPVYGGNKNRVGWEVIGFPGPESLADTMTGRYSTREYFIEGRDWADLIPQLRDGGRGHA